MTTKTPHGFFAVSGSAGRIGAEVCRNLVATGHNVVGLDVAFEPAAIRESGDQLIQVTGSVSKASDVEKAITCGEENFGQLLGSVHCAYPRNEAWQRPFEDLTLDSLAADFRDQLATAILFSQITSLAMKSGRNGSVVLLASIQGVRAPRFRHYEGLEMTSPAAYSAIKGGVISYTRWLAKYLSGTGIRVNCVSPGGILADQPELFQQRYREDCLTKGLLDADDVVGAINFLLSDDSRYISGQNIVVDDGWSL